MPATDDHTLRVGATVVVEPPDESALDAFEHLAGKTGVVTAIAERAGGRIVSVRLTNGHYVDLPAHCVVPA